MKTKITFYNDLVVRHGIFKIYSYLIFILVVSYILFIFLNPDAMPFYLMISILLISITGHFIGKIIGLHEGYQLGTMTQEEALGIDDKSLGIDGLEIDGLDIKVEKKIR